MVSEGARRHPPRGTRWGRAARRIKRVSGEFKREAPARDERVRLGRFAPPRGADAEYTAMRVLITGAAGRIGQEVIQELLLRGHRLRGLDLEAALRGDLEWVAADIRDLGG